jgi:hypothetical protein
MLDSETVIRKPHDGREAAPRRGRAAHRRAAKYIDARVSVAMKTEGVELQLFFDDLSGEGPVREVRVLPDTGALEPTVLRRLAPRLPLYVSYARAAIQIRREDTAAAARELRAFGATRRGLGPDFFRLIAGQYNALVAEGEPHPVKTLAEMHHVTISAASRWIKEARQRPGLIKDTKEE